MTNIDPALVDQMAQTITGALAGCDLRTDGAAVYGGNVAAGAVTPLVAAAVERAKAEGIAEGERRVRERVEAELPPPANTYENLLRVLDMNIQDWWKVHGRILAALGKKICGCDHTVEAHREATNCTPQGCAQCGCTWSPTQLRAAQDGTP